MAIRYTLYIVGGGADLWDGACPDPAVLRPARHLVPVGTLACSCLCQHLSLRMF
jgi:hypothetical protein